MNNKLFFAIGLAATLLQAPVSRIGPVFWYESTEPSSDEE